MVVLAKIPGPGKRHRMFHMPVGMLRLDGIQSPVWERLFLIVCLNLLCRRHECFLLRFLGKSLPRLASIKYTL
jgi:hypothetical protein